MKHFTYSVKCLFQDVPQVIINYLDVGERSGMGISRYCSLSLKDNFTPNHLSVESEAFFQRTVTVWKLASIRL